jgi:two-component system chemotaxis response regulator CheB
MVVDDSALIREFMRQIILSHPNMELITANDPFQARDKLLREKPDVIILDVEMPKMDGLTFLQKLMNFYPIPVIMFSSITQNGAEATIKALSLGAVDFIAKPTSGLKDNLPHVKAEIIEKIKTAATAKLRKHTDLAQMEVPKKLEIGDVVPLKKGVAPSGGPMVALLGASTGGTEALEQVLINIPADSPPIAVVQHMPEHFTLAFANRLNNKCRIKVTEAVHGQALPPGSCLIAPGGSQHMFLEKSPNGGYMVKLQEAPPVNRHRPSVDVLFRSAVNSAGPSAMAVIMTGMGDDGARGMKDLHDAGAFTVAQDQKTCTVYGMPKMAVQMGGVDKIAPLDGIAGLIMQRWQQARRG